ncbi:MAG TPA: SDR family oxidoreductase, partial [Thermomicrobiales bacterium]|nr:SDR family oxidoreductase [Thermomicrobiales bacterium]
MSVSFDFTGRAVIVTGAARGIGRVMVARFAASGASVLAADRDEEGLAATCRDLDPARVATLVADVSSEAGAESIVAAAVRRFGRLDVCVNNAAVAPHASLFDERVEVWDTIYAVNTRGT